MSALPAPERSHAAKPDHGTAERFRRRELVTFDRALSKTARIVFFALDEYARDKAECWPREKTICHRLGISTRTFQRAVKQLKAQGFLSVSRLKEEHGPNLYKLGSHAPESFPHATKMTHSHATKMTQSAPASLLNQERTMKQENNTPQPPAETAVAITFTEEQFAELEEGYDRHLKHHRQEPRDIVLQMLMDQAQRGKFDWRKFRDRHRQWCASQERSGWRFCSLTFLAWIRAGYPPAPAEPIAINRKSTFTESVERGMVERLKVGLLPL